MGVVVTQCKSKVILATTICMTLIREHIVHGKGSGAQLLVHYKGFLICNCNELHQKPLMPTISMTTCILDCHLTAGIITDLQHTVEYFHSSCHYFGIF